MRNRIRNYCNAALFAAVISVTAQISVPMPPIPLNLALFGVFLAATILDLKSGFSSVCIYLALGAIGLPVFAGFQGGLQTFAGPTGGFLFGYTITALLTGWIVKNNRNKFAFYPVGMIVGCLPCYFFGTVWFTLSTHTQFIPALMVCILPFLPGDMIKIALASTLAYRINRMKIENP